jgi:ECF sigma factor
MMSCGGWGVRRCAFGSRSPCLQPMALVHEAWIRIAGQKQVSMQCRKQFYGLAAKVMRDILADH